MGNTYIQVINDEVPMIILFLIMGILIKVISRFYGKNDLNLWYEMKAFVYIIYAFILFQLATSTDFESYSNNFIPFREILRYKSTSPLFWRNIIGNIAIFIPFGYMATDIIKMTCKKFNFYTTMFAVLVTTLSIEVIQYFIGRTFDIDDIILNVLGGLIGYFIFKIIHIFSKE